MDDRDHAQHDLERRVALTDPLRGRDDEVDALVDELTTLLQRRDVLDDGRVVRTPRAGSGLKAWMAAAAAFVVLIVLPGVAMVSNPAWALEPLAGDTVRVSYATILGHGPDPAGLVEELQRHGVTARIEHRTTWWPLAFGRIISLETEWTPGGRAADDGELPDPAGYGVSQAADGNGFLLDTDVFNDFQGRITIVVGRPPGS